MAPQLRALPGLLQALALLPLHHAAISARVDRALAENPALRRKAGTPCPGCGRHRRAGPCPQCSGTGPRLTAEPAVDPFAELEVLAGCEIRTDCRPALPVVIGHLIERGLLPAPAEEIAAAHGLAPAAVAEAIRALRAAGPPGIAERSVPDLLLAQARALVAAGRAPAPLVDLVRDHLAALADGDLDGPAAALGLPVAAVAELLVLVRTRLRPGVWLGPAAPRTVPDVLSTARTTVAERRGGRQPLVRPGRGGDAPRRLLAPTRRPRPGSAATSGPRATSSVSSTRGPPCCAGWRRPRWRTRRSSCRRGAAGTGTSPGADVAAALALHPSTVSRAVAGKALRAPDGRILELAALFGRAVPVKTRIAELAPRRLSDARLCPALATEGHAARPPDSGEVPGGAGHRRGWPPNLTSVWPRRSPLRAPRLRSRSSQVGSLARFVQWKGVRATTVPRHEADLMHDIDRALFESEFEPNQFEGDEYAGENE